MQDNWTNMNLEDQGWEAMETLLDREMPVRSRRRKPIFWLFFRLRAFRNFIN